MASFEFVKTTHPKLIWLAERAVSHYATFAKRDPTKRLCESAERLGELINTVLTASLVTEESKFHALSIAVGFSSRALKATPDMAAHEGHFETQLSFDTEQLAKLAPMCSENKLSLLLDLTEDFRLVVSGVAFEPFYSILKVVITDIGALNIYLLNSLEFIFSVKSGLVHVGDPWKSDLTGYVWATLDRSLKDDLVSRPTGEVIAAASATSAALGRGGAIIVVPQGYEGWRKSIDLSSGHWFESPLTQVADALRKYIAALRKLRVACDNPLKRERLIDSENGIGYARLKLRRTAQSLASLTTIDGALLIDDRLNVLGCGVKITALTPPSPLMCVDLNPIRGEILRIAHTTLGGTRHVSAANFVISNKKSFAMVVSQDGKVSLIAWDRKKSTLKRLRLDDLIPATQRGSLG